MGKPIHPKWSKTQEIHGKPAILVAHWIDLGAYYCDCDDVVWTHSSQYGWINRGDYAEFKEHFAARYRGEFIGKGETCA